MIVLECNRRCLIRWSVDLLVIGRRAYGEGKKTYTARRTVLIDYRPTGHRFAKGVVGGRCDYVIQIAPVRPFHISCLDSLLILDSLLRSLPAASCTSIAP